MATTPRQSYEKCYGSQQHGPGYPDVYFLVDRNYPNPAAVRRFNHTADALIESSDLLQKDAKDIHAALDVHTANRTTVLCAALMDKNTGEVRSFVFTNAHRHYFDREYDTVYRHLVREAQMRGYHVVQAQQSHAECSLVQFLSQMRGDYDKYPLRAGCSREICQDCVDLLDALWGRERREEIFGSSKRSDDVDSYKSFNWYTPAALMGIILHSGGTEEFRKCHRPQFADCWRYEHTESCSYFGCDSRIITDDEMGIARHTVLEPRVVMEPPTAPSFSDTCANGGEIRNNGCSIKHSWHTSNTLY